MPGRYEFSLPERPMRDGWFRIGSVDVTTTALLVGLGVISMVVYAIDPDILSEGAYLSTAVRDGEVWRLALWPLVNPPDSIWVVLTLVFFWFFGHHVEDRVGRKPFTILIVAMTILPAMLTTALDVANDTRTGWTAYAYGLGILSIGLLVVFALDNPNARFFFGIPAWVIAAVIVGIDVLRLTGDRLWAMLVLELLVIAVACIGARQMGMLDDLHFIPRVVRHAGSTGGAAKPRRTRGGGRRRGTRGAPGGVVEGPWVASGPTPLEQAELDVLLDKISSGGIDSLTAIERERLQILSKRLRDR